MLRRDPRFTPRARGIRSREPLKQMGPCSGSPSAANGPHTRSSAAEGHQSSWFWARRSAGAGMARLAASCSTYSASGRKEPRQLSAARPPRAGRAVGGAYWLLPCSRPSPARHWGRLGQRRSTRARGMSRPSSECSSSPEQQRAPVACRCARSGRRCGFLASSESVA